jgi:hypothetical protein
MRWDFADEERSRGEALVGMKSVMAVSLES